MRTEYTDCGSKASGLKERNDCTVRATAAALRIPYPEARQKLAALGRKPRCGFKFREPAMKALGFESMPEFSCMTWQKVEKALPSLGAFVIRVRQHVFAVVDSVVMDRTFRELAVCWRAARCQHSPPGSGVKDSQVLLWKARWLFSITRGIAARRDVGKHRFRWLAIPRVCRTPRHVRQR